MSKRILKTAVSIFVFAILATNVFSQTKISGTVKDQASGSPVPYATAALLRPDSSIITGALTGDEGQFVIENVAAGNYLLQISLIGYEKSYRTVNVPAQSDLGEILISESASNLQEVVVRAERIVRMPDRFIINLANDPTVVGKLGTDALNLSPGVFVEEHNGTISINGKSGTKVYVNERPRNESGTQLIQYLRTLKAEDIVRIEVLPNAGAAYDADIQGGIIKITLKRQRDDGMNGNIGANYKTATENNVNTLNSSFGINYKNKGFSLYSQLNYDQLHNVERVTEETRYSDRTVSSTFEAPQIRQTPNARFGIIYELNENQSIGLEGNYYHEIINGKSSGVTTDMFNGNRTDVSSLYDTKHTRDNYAASANYILRFGPSGSTFKVLLDYFHNEADNKVDYNSVFSGYLNRDTVYRSKMFTQNDVYAASTDLTFQLKNQSSFAAGLKYIRNNMANNVLFEYLQGTNWFENEPYSYESRYTENIAAVYGTFSSRINKTGYSLGLRGEYTTVAPWSNKTDKTEDQDYFELFPTISVMMPFGKANQHSLVLNYNRKIQRPSFNQLIPYRMPGSEFLYIEGNPKLKPALTNNFSAAFRLFNRFNIVAALADSKGTFEEVFQTDPNTPGVIIRRTENVGNRRNYILSANTNLRPTAWWQIILNLTGLRSEVTVFDIKRTMNTFIGNMSSTFTLPNNYLFDLNGNYLSPVINGNTKITRDPFEVGVALRKEFLNRRLSMRMYVDNIFDSGIIRLETNEKDFNRNMRVRYSYRQFGLSLRYNFQAGKSIQVKNVETGAAEEKARLQ